MGGGQTLARLEARGGLGWCEAAAILEDRDWRKMDKDAARDAVMRHYDAYKVMSAQLAQEIEEMSNGQ